MKPTVATGIKSLLIAYGTCLTLLVVFDAVWLGVVAASFYEARLGHLMAPSPRLDAALVFYLLYPAAIVLFAIKPAIDSGSASKALPLGAAFGFFAYATYDLTNLATLRDWSVLVSMVDIGWGTAISGAIAWLGRRAVGMFDRRKR